MKSMFVARGRTVVIEGVNHAPGTMVTLPDDEIERLRAAGFVQETPPDLRAPDAPNPSGIGLQNRPYAQGPTFTR